MLLDVIADTLVDALKLLPFLFLTYLAMEYIEHKAGDKAEELVEKAGGFGPLIGSVLGMVHWVPLYLFSFPHQMKCCRYLFPIR